MTPEEKTELKLNIGKIPQIILDNTDRNRTSPLAFTGNKFEFRAVGSSANCAPAMIVLNASLADQLKDFRSTLQKAMDKGEDKDEAIFKILRNYISESWPILFEGNGYSEEWVREAAERGLSNFPSTPQALKAYISTGTKKLFAGNQILTERAGGTLGDQAGKLFQGNAN